MEHKHIYDAEGNQLCCTQQEKIYTNAGAEDLLKERHSKNDGHYHGIKYKTDLDHDTSTEHAEADGHDHTSGKESTSKCFIFPSFHSSFYFLPLHWII
jgi:Cd2+/Zn2+-exporting ATPase